MPTRFKTPKRAAASNRVKDRPSSWEARPVLIVEDDARQRSGIERAQAGHIVDAASSGNQALAPSRNATASWSPTS